MKGSSGMTKSSIDSKSFRQLAMVTFLAFVMVILSYAEARAETVELPTEELAQESVLPKFDRNDSVRQRNVVTKNRFELGAYYGFNTTEPIYNQSKMGFNIGYHWSEDSAVVVNYAQWMNGLNTLYTDSLNETSSLEFDRAPKLKYSLYGHYEWKIFYGKISLTKQGVLNLTTYPILGAGITAYEHKNYPGVDFGVGQKFYFGKNFALRFDFKMQFSESPSPFLKGKMATGQPEPEASEFKSKWGLNTILDLGFTILL